MPRRDNSPKRHHTKAQLTSNQKEWKHQVTNLKRRIKDLEGLGFVVDFKIPEMPKRVGKAAIEKIKNIGRKTLEKHAYKENQSTGELKPFEPIPRGQAKDVRRRVKRERELQRELDNQRKWFDEDYDEYQDYSWTESEEPNVYDVVLENLKNYIEGFNENRNKSLQEWSKGKLLSLLESAIEREGAEEIASRAETMAGLADLAQAALWQSKQDRAEMHIRGFANVLYGRSSSRVDKIFMERIYEEVGMYG